MSWLADIAGLSVADFAFLAVLCFLAGIVRGFAGFALSAIVMALGVLVLPPVALIPMLWWQEMAASLLMARGGWRDANRPVVFGLVIGSQLGLPLGMSLTVMIDPITSSIIALALIIGLSLFQISGVKMPWMARREGPLGAGFLAGIGTGLANIGGMVVAVFVLSRGGGARGMRGALVLFLFVSSLFSFFQLIAFGVMTWEIAYRALTFVPVTLIGVIIGQRLFSPRLEPYYKPFCLSLLIILSLLSLGRMVF